MTRDPETLLLGGLGLLVVVIILAVVLLGRRRGAPDPDADPLELAERPHDIAPWVLEGRRLFDHWQERIERLDELKARLSGMAQEIEQLRAEIGHIDEMRMQITRLQDEIERYRIERDRLREVLLRIGALAEEASRPSE